MSSNIVSRVIGATALSFVVAIAALAAPQAGTPPGGTPPTIPAQIKIQHQFRLLCFVTYVDENEYAKVRVGIDTMSKRVAFSWQACKSGALIDREYTTEAVSFWPTALCRSRVDPQAFYVAGRSSTGPVIEHWKFNGDQQLLVAQLQPSGKSYTVFSRPTVTKTAVQTAATLGNIAEMTAVAPAPALAVTEELWVMEWESRNVFAVSSAVSGLPVRIPATVGSLYRSMEGRTHSTFGSVVILERRPWQMSTTDWAYHVNANASLDTDRVVAQDADLDGTMEGSFVIPVAQYETHALYTTGSFTDN